MTRDPTPTGVYSGCAPGAARACARDGVGVVEDHPSRASPLGRRTTGAASPLGAVPQSCRSRACRSRFTAVNGLHRGRVAQHEGDALGGTQIGEPIPRECALGLEPVHVRPAAREVQKRDGLQNDAVRIEESEHAGARPERVPEDYGTTVNLARAVMVRVIPSSEPPNGRARLVMRT
jgi:hypothetical protein